MTAIDTPATARTAACVPKAAGSVIDALSFQSLLLASVGQAIVAVDLNRTILYWNRAAEEMFGWTADEVLGRTSTEMLVRGDSTQRAPEIIDKINRGEGWSGELEIQHRDGTHMWVFVTNRPVLNAKREPIAVVGTAIDVTLSKAEDTARRQLSAIVSSSADAIFGVTFDGVITSWNHAAEKLFGYRADEIVGRMVSVLAPDELRHEQVSVRQRLIDGTPFEIFETMRRRKDGSLVDVMLTISRTTDEQGNMIGSSVIARDITESLKARRALEASTRRLEEAQRIAHLGSFEINLTTREVNWSDEMYRIFGIEIGRRLQPSDLLEMVHPDDRVPLSEVMAESGRSGVPVDHSFRVVRPDGSKRSVRARVITGNDLDGKMVRMSGTVVDETEWVQAEAIRRVAESRFEIGFEQSAIGAVIADLDGNPVRVNQVVRDILGRTDAELIGHQWTEFTHPDEVPLREAVRAKLRNGETYQDERRYIRPDGTVAWAATHVALVRDGDVPQYAYVQLQDITQRKEMEAERSRLALHDSLTGLPNRLLLNDRLQQGLANAQRRGTRLGVIFLDLDQFKVVNDSMGHTSGDGMLSEAASRIERAIRPGDTVARFGGDEFVIVCDDVDPVGAQLVAQRVLRAFGRPWLIEGQEIHVTASLGIALSTERSTPDSLLRDSDTAMYRAKELGRGRIEMFDEGLSMRASQRLSMSSALHHALERNELSIHYQPVVDLATREMVSVEALLRWNCAALGEVSPSEFVPVAEETGLIVPIGAWLLEEACRQLVDWQHVQTSMGRWPSLSLAVNLSVRQMLSPDIANRIARVLARSGMRASDLCLELTESVFMQDLEYFGHTLNDLKSLGVTLAIDDFGTGYSSLSYLRRFPVDAVKIDRAFIDGLETDSNDTALVQAIVAMARALDLSITAEGVETGRQVFCLSELGVPRAQGFCFARPMPATALTELLRSRQPLGPQS